jgi:hypothetical protein
MIKSGNNFLYANTHTHTHPLTFFPFPFSSVPLSLLHYRLCGGERNNAGAGVEMSVAIL